MIDPELDQLSRALIAATDRLNSEDFRDRQSRYVRDELALRELAEGLEADEKAVEDAQAALTAHVSRIYLASDLAQTAEDDDEGVPLNSRPYHNTAGPVFVPGATYYQGVQIINPDDELFNVRALPEDDDTPEESTARSAGALS